MHTTSRKADRIDILKMYAQYNESDLQELFHKKVQDDNLRWFEDLMQAAQYGMRDAQKNKLNSDQINAWFAWLIRFIEKCMVRIIRTRRPCVNDNPTNSIVTGKPSVYLIRV